MNTHILIPIKDIEDAYKRYTDNAFWQHVVGNLIYENGKQISLSEESMEEVAAERMMQHYKETNYPIMTKDQASMQLIGATIGYKQALKDLL